MSNHLLAKYPKYQKFKISAHLPWGRGRTVFFLWGPFLHSPSVSAAQLHRLSGKKFVTSQWNEVLASR